MLCSPKWSFLKCIERWDRSASTSWSAKSQWAACAPIKLLTTFKAHARLNKLNREHLRKAAPRLWERLQEGDEDLAREIAQGVLVSNLAFVVEVLDFLEIPHDGNGFFDKDGAAAEKLTEGWQKRVLRRVPRSAIRKL